AGPRWRTASRSTSVRPCRSSILQEARQARRRRRRRRRLRGAGTPDQGDRRALPARPALITRKNAEQIALMRRAGEVVAEMHEVCIRAAVPGATTLQVDAVAREVIAQRGAR